MKPPEHDDAAQSDWEEQDLLTIDLAAERLEEEIVVLTGEIAAAPADLDLTDRRLRLDRLVEARDRFRRRP